MKRAVHFMPGSMVKQFKVYDIVPTSRIACYLDMKLNTSNFTHTKSEKNGFFFKLCALNFDITYQLSAVQTSAR